jgi:hypothetical protein
MRQATSLYAFLALGSAVLGCAVGLDGFDGDQVKTSDDKSDTSAVAVFVNFEFDAEAVTDSAWNPNGTIEDQLLYTIGHLNGDGGVGRLDRLELADVNAVTVEGKTRISYHARLPVAWGKRNDVPTTYKLGLPRDLSYQGQSAFTDKYKDSCVDWGAHDVTSGSMWYYYRPNAGRCQLADADIVTTTADVTVSDINTTGKFPEYHKIWEDDIFRVVAVFGKYEDGAQTASDAGIAGYNEFVSAITDELDQHALATMPVEVPESPGVAVPDIQFAATLPDGKRVEVAAILVDNVRNGGAAFDQRFGDLSTRADLIVYNGHAGLGANIRALARKGHWTAGQYVVVFMNGCDTYAYVDAALFDAHAAVNPSDPTGTKHTDIVTNALPSFFRSMPHATMALVRGLIAHQTPQTYERIFAAVDASQVVLVSGEQDNEFVPGGGGTEPPPTADWTGLAAAGTVAVDEEQRWQTPTLPAGDYVFEMTGTDDADLYVRVGTAPNQQLFDCRPYLTGSDETCVVPVPAAAPVHVMIRGWAPTSTFELAGARR